MARNTQGTGLWSPHIPTWIHKTVQFKRNGTLLSRSLLLNVPPRFTMARPHVGCDNQRKEPEPVQLPTGIWGQIQLNLTLREPTREENKNIN